MSGDTWTQVGTVEILRARVYPLDASSRDDHRATAFVEPGSFPVYRKADAYLWLMTGQLNERTEKIGDGLFVMHGGDNPGGLEVTFPSQIFGVDQFNELLTEPVCQPGPDQRLRFTLNEVTA